MIKFLEIGMFPVYIGFCSRKKEYKESIKKIWGWTNTRFYCDATI